MLAIALTYLLNGIMMLILLKGFARSGDTAKRPIGRIAVLSLVFFLDACLLLWMDCSPRAVGYLVVVFCLAAIRFPESLTANFTQALREKRFAVYIASVFTIAALFFFYLPITTFITSPGELSIQIGYLLTTNARGTMVAIYVASILYALAFSPRLKALLTLIAVSSVLLALIYAYGYPFGYPKMNGFIFEQVPIEASVIAMRGLVDLATVVCGVLLSVLALTKFGTRKVLLAIFLVNASLALASGITIAKDRLTVPENAGSATATADQPIRYGKGKSNVLVLFLDRFMGGFVEDILKQEPQLGAALDGFTWYPRTLAPGENSIAGMPAMLGGYDYTPRQMNARKQLLRDSSVESYAILPYNFIKKGYAANLVSPRGLGFTMEGDCSFLDHLEGLNCTHIPVSVTKQLADEYHMPTQVLASSLSADLLVLLGLMRGTPYLMRAVLHEKGPWRPFLDHSAGTTFKQWAELKSLPKLSTTASAQSNINVVFNLLPHEPYFMGEDCLPRSKMLEAPPDAVGRGHVSTFSFQHYVAARCALLLTADYLQWMKQAGVYDDTKIVIVSDHGIVGPVEDHSSRAVAGGTTDNMFVRSRSLLLVKERNAHGPMHASDEFMPNAEVPRIVCQEIGGCVNPYLGNKSIEAHGRNRPFFVDFVPWQANLQEPMHFNIQGSMVLDGPDPYNVDNWRRGPAQVAH